MDHETITLRIPRNTPAVQLLQTLTEAGFVLRMGQDGLTGEYFPERASRRERPVDELLLSEDSRADLRLAQFADVVHRSGRGWIVWLKSRHWRTERLMFGRDSSAMVFHSRAAAVEFIRLRNPAVAEQVEGGA
jgi:hypothetical protein